MILLQQDSRSFSKVDIENIKSILKGIVNQKDYITWLKDLSFELTDTSCKVLSSNKFCNDFIKNKFSSEIQKAINSLYPFVNNINYSVSISNYENDNNIPNITSVKLSDNEVSIINTNNINHRGLNKSYTFKNFITDNTNELSIVAAKQISNLSSITNFKQIYIYGNNGTGKTHLLHSIGNQIVSQKPDAKVIYMSAEKFMYEFIKHSRAKTLMEFKDDLRSAYCLIIDDINFLSGKEGSEIELSHTIRELSDAGKRVILAGNKSPFMIDGLSKQLKSEISSSLVLEVSDFTEDLRKKVIQTKLFESNINISNEVIEFLSSKDLNGKEIDGAIKRIFMYASLSNDEMTISYINNLLKDIFYSKSENKQITISNIKKNVCDFYEITVQQIDSYLKEHSVALPRQIAMYLSKHLTDKSLMEIGNMFGGKDHATVLYAVKKIEKKMNDSIEFSKQIEAIERLCKA